MLEIIDLTAPPGSERAYLHDSNFDNRSNNVLHIHGITEDDLEKINDFFGVRPLISSKTNEFTVYKDRNDNAFVSKAEVVKPKESLVDKAIRLLNDDKFLTYMREQLYVHNFGPSNSEAGAIKVPVIYNLIAMFIASNKNEGKFTITDIVECRTAPGTDESTVTNGSVSNMLGVWVAEKYCINGDLIIFRNSIKQKGTYHTTSAFITFMDEVVSTFNG
jgi:hypothetical protein